MKFTDEFGCVPDLSYFQMPGERQFRRTHSSMDKPVQNETEKQNPSNRANNAQITESKMKTSLS